MRQAGSPSASVDAALCSSKLSCFDVPTIRHTPKQLPLSICVWPLPTFHCFVTLVFLQLGSGFCFAISVVERSVVSYVAGGYE
jgi:hypothetical protein